MKTHSHLKQIGKTLCALALVACAVGTARAATFYGDFTGNYFSGYTMGPGGGTNNYIAEGFTMTQSLDLQSVDILVSNFQSNAGSGFVLSIFSNGVGDLPGTDLYDLSTNVTTVLSGSPAQLTYSGTGSFMLNAGAKYWLMLAASNPNAQTGSTMVWVGAYTDSFAGFATPSGVGATEIGQNRSFFPTTVSTTELRTAFQLNGAAVPEPSSMALLVAGLLGIVGTYCQRR